MLQMAHKYKKLSSSFCSIPEVCLITFQNV